VAESEHSLAFKDLYPNARTHILVVPRGPYVNVADFIESASMEEQRDFWALVLHVAEKAGVRDSFQIRANNGKGAGQAVFHFHIHILSDK
jgi:histidine triad (HIT) family protein